MPFAAYFDASGREDSQVLTVGGYFASVKVCEAIEGEWKAALGGDGPFHLTDLGRESCKLGSGEWDLPKRIAFVKRLGNIVNRPGNHILSISVDTAVYSSFVRTSPHAHVYGPAYSACAQLCFSMAEYMLDHDHMQHEEVAYTFEIGDRQHELEQSFYEHDAKAPDFQHKRSLHFLPKKTPLLQPTDLISGKIQEILLRAHSKLPSLDNGSSLTPLDRFERYYSHDGTSVAVLGDTWRPLFSFVANEKLFRQAEYRVSEIFRNHPAVLERRLKQYKNQNKRTRQ